MATRSPVTLPGYRAGQTHTSADFGTLDGRPLQANSVRGLLPRRAQKVGIKKPVHPYGLRHTCAAALTIQGVPTPLMQRQLGNAHLHTAERDAVGRTRRHTALEEWSERACFTADERLRAGSEQGKEAGREATDGRTDTKGSWGA